MAKLIDPRHHRTLIAGMTGSGKTYYALQLFTAMGDMALYIDHEGVVRRKAWAAHLHSVMTRDPSQIKPIWFARNEAGVPNRKCVLEPNSDEEIGEVLRWIIKWKREVQDPKPLYVFMDEIHLYGQDWKFPEVTDVFTRGRNSNVIGVAITQNLPALRNTSVITQSKVKILFSLDPAAITALRRNYQVEIPPEVLAHIQVDADKAEGERTIFQAAAYGLSGDRWILL